MDPNVYPERTVHRDRWIVGQRGTRNPVDAFRPYHFLSETEPSDDGKLKSISTIFLTNRECPWKCVMCDLWKNTLTETVPAGAIPAQIGYALERLGPTGQIKLYNSGSFFDPRAIPPDDFPAIASRLENFERVIVECHPALIGKSAVQFRDMIRGKLEVALGLETAHPDVLENLNKRVTLERFEEAADFLLANEIDMRMFVLVKPPFLKEHEGLEWTKKSIDYAFECGASVVSLIPTRGGNGAMEVLARAGLFTLPEMRTIEAAFEYGINLERGRVFVDLWDLERFSDCDHCFEARRERLNRMNLEQRLIDSAGCAHCLHGACR